MQCALIHLYLPMNKTTVILLVLNGPGIDAEHCILESVESHVTVHPLSALCFVNGEVIQQAHRLKQGMNSGHFLSLSDWSIA